MTTQTFPFIVKESRMITPNVLHLGFAPASETPFDFIPGQFITIHFTLEDKAVKRSYSIASIPGRSPTIEIAASYFPGGPGTEYLFHLKPGDTVEVSGPFGKLTLREEAIRRYILVATGTGVTPYRAMLPEIEARLTQGLLDQVVVLLGVQGRSELLYVNDFLHAAEQLKGFTFRAHYSRETADDLRPYEHKGYVQTGFNDLDLSAEHDIVYLCGNPKMIDDAFELLKSLGFESSKIRREKYISSPIKN